MPDSTPTYALRVTDLGQAKTQPKTSAVQLVGAGRRLRPLGAARDAAGSVQPTEVAADELVRVEYDSGVVLWMRADDLLRERGRKAPGERGAGAGDAAWDIDGSAPAADGATRGALGLGIRVLEFFGVDLTGAATAQLAQAVEKRQLKGNPPGLYRCPLDASQPLQPVPDGRQALPTDKPVLLFLHGTMSSWRGSYGDLESSAGGEAGDAATAARESLRKTYGEHIYSFEHLTLTQSPIQNALELAAHLPPKVELHIVSHSRGGLVGELLCLAGRDLRNDPLAGGLVEQLFASDRTLAPQLGLPPLTQEEAAERSAGYAADAQRLRQLVALLDETRPQVRRFVRVACPARGTTLASGRLDRWLSVLDLIVPGGLFGDVADFLLAVLKRRTDPRTLPGIEAMMPGSALTLLLQRPDLVTSSDLTVIAGDTEGEGLWGRIKLLATDWFYAADHDLVVNTGSMSGGLRRVPGGARFLLDKGEKVNHFSYFSNRESLRWMLAGLARPDGADGGFQPIAAAPKEEPRWRSAVQRSRAAAQGSPRPIVVMVPGTMGSALNAGGDAVWLNYWVLLRGGLSRIGADAADVQPVELLDDFYGPLVEHLARVHRVEVHPYDWRLSVREAAKTLTTRLEALLPEAERTRQPLHIVAHSMGGLVARSMIADGGPGAMVWRRMCALPGSRLLMLGTPNRGSHEAVRWLTGFNPTQAKLTLLDLAHGVDGIIDIVRRFPGLVELLPFGEDPNPYAKLDTWKRLKSDLGAGFPLVDEGVLREAARTWTLLRNAPPDPARMLYVAGCQRATVLAHVLAEPEFGFRTKRLEWLASAEGDGTVTWESGRLPEVPMYYAEDTSHDELCSNTDDRRIFRGYVELLGAGRTDQLSMTPPRRARSADGQPVRFRLPPQPVADDLPDEAAVRGLSFSGTRKRRRRAVATQVVGVSVRHGDLAYALYPVLVGHYRGDTIVSAEAALDERLGGALSRHLALDLYPGPPGSHAVFWNENPTRSPSCAVVVGLGQVGQLSASRLEVSVRDAMLEQVFQLLQRPGARPADGARIKANFSSLLIGTGANSVRVRESLEAILRAALAANRMLEAAHLDDRVLVDQLEFVEVNEDVAIGAALDLAMVVDGRDLSSAVHWAPRAVIDGQGRRKRRYISPDAAWDQRIEIVADPEVDRLRFIATTDRARAEETLATGQLRLADSFIAQACASTASNAEVAKTLFEMLLPMGMKEAAPDQRGLVLLLDEASARFPWELLEDRWSRNGRPPAITGGIVRQFKTDIFRERPAQAPENSVLVVGNPDLEGSLVFPDLPGAREEAQQVAQLFRGRGWDTLDLIDQKALGIVGGLHGRAWRVLHLAGHGEHRYTDEQQTKPLSGMVIGNGIFLTPGDVQQMRYVPELVFINCCHLGKTGNRKDPDYNLLAANLGLQFIRMGVRAVVAAGWAVDDAAAMTFSRTFYADLFAGQTFRDAVRRARDETHGHHPDVNTWGAYQCYGDPGWCLVRSNGGGEAWTPPGYVSPRELLADLDNLVESARVRKQRDDTDAAKLSADLRESIDALKLRVPADERDPNQAGSWLARADVAAALGFAYGEGMLFSEAVDWLNRALGAPEGDCPVRAVEQCANFRVRLAADEWNRARTAGAALPAARQAELVRIIMATVAELDVINQRSETAERLKLLGSACKRLAWVQADLTPRIEALLNMAQYYRRAFDTPHEQRAGALTNWGVACLLLARLDPERGRGAWRPELATLCTRQAELDLAQYATQPELWLAIGQADLALVHLLLADDDAAACERQATTARRVYADAFARGASPREIGIVREHIEFLIELTADPAGHWPEAVRSALASVRAGM